MSRPPDPEITELLHAWRQGDRDALDVLMPLIYEELKKRARRYLRGERRDCTLQTTDLVHEVYFRFVEADQVWEGRNHFFALVAKKIRELLVDRARAKQAQKRGGGCWITDVKTSMDDPGLPAEVLRLHDALKDLERFDPRKAQILEMRYFGGMLNVEIANALEVSESTVERDQRLARAWLARYLSDGPSESGDDASN